MLYKNLMVTTNQKPIIDTHTQKKKECKYNIKDSHQIIKEKNLRREKKKKDLQKQVHSN